MDILKRSIAPITEEAWNEIDSQARKTLKEQLTARRFVDISGPHGWDFGAVVTGHLKVNKPCDKNDVCWGVHVVQPLVEFRVPFELETWDLDDAIRGAKDLDLDPLIDATRNAALFEEKVIYNGFEPAGITGLSQVNLGNKTSISLDSTTTIMSSLLSAIIKLKEDSIEGPYMLLASHKLWQALNIQGEGYPLMKRVSSIFESGVVLVPHIQGALVVSTRGGDFELTLGQDFCIGYESTMENKVRLFIAESLTFRIIEPKAVVPLEISQA